MKKININGEMVIFGEGFSLLRIWRKLRRNCWNYYSDMPTIGRNADGTPRHYGIRIIPKGEGQSQDWSEIEWLTESQLLYLL